jgi:AbrB family looped-hinge helix DNA binding protein
MEILVDTVTISPKYQVVIPREVRERLGLTPGQKVQALAYENRIELIPVRPLKAMRGFLKGIETTLRRERDRL